MQPLQDDDNKAARLQVFPDRTDGQTDRETVGRHRAPVTVATVAVAATRCKQRCKQRAAH